MHAAKDPAAGGAVGGGGGARVWAEAQGTRTLVASTSLVAFPRLRAAAAAAQKQEHRPDDQHAHPQSQRRTAARRRVTREEEGDTVAAWRVASAAHIAQPAERERHAWLLRPPSPRRVGCRCRCCRCCHRAPASAAGRRDQVRTLQVVPAHSQRESRCPARSAEPCTERKQSLPRGSLWNYRRGDRGAVRCKRRRRPGRGKADADGLRFDQHRRVPCLRHETVSAAPARLCGRPSCRPFVAATRQRESSASWGWVYKRRGETSGRRR